MFFLDFTVISLSGQSEEELEVDSLINQGGFVYPILCDNI